MSYGDIVLDGKYTKEQINAAITDQHDGPSPPEKRINKIMSRWESRGSLSEMIVSSRDGEHLGALKLTRAGKFTVSCRHHSPWVAEIFRSRYGG